MEHTLQNCVRMAAAFLLSSLAAVAGHGASVAVEGDVKPVAKNVLRRVDMQPVRVPLFGSEPPRPHGYIPNVGPAALRIHPQDQTFDRSTLVALDAFFSNPGEEPLDVPPISDESPVYAGPGVLPEFVLPDYTPPQFDTGRRPQRTEQPREPSEPIAASLESVTSAPATPAGLVPLPPSINEGALVNPDEILRYFEIRDRVQGGGGRGGSIGVPFVLPYQSQQPLIMESGAAYQQSDGQPASDTTAAPEAE